MTDYPRAFVLSRSKKQASITTFNWVQQVVADRGGYVHACSFFEIISFLGTSWTRVPKTEAAGSTRPQKRGSTSDRPVFRFYSRHMCPGAMLRVFHFGAIHGRLLVFGYRCHGYSQNTHFHSRTYPRCNCVIFDSLHRD